MEKPHMPGKFEECENCGRKTRKTCQRCGIAKYCSPKCQKEDWEVHQDECTTDKTVIAKKKLEELAVEIDNAVEEQFDECLNKVFGSSGLLYTFVNSLLYGWRKKEYPLVCIANLKTNIY